MVKVKMDSSDSIAFNPYRSILDKDKSIQSLKLPKIDDEQIRKSTMTHSSIPLDSIEDQLKYGKLGFMGRGILFSVITSLIQEVFPEIDKESASALRDEVISSPILSSLSIYYKIPSKMMISRHIIESIRNSIKSTSEMFEVYIGGLFYSYRKQHIQKLEFEFDKLDPALLDQSHYKAQNVDGPTYENKNGSGKKSKKRKLDENNGKNLSTSPVTSEVGNSPNNSIHIDDTSNGFIPDNSLTIKVQANSQAYIEISKFLEPLFKPLVKILYDPKESETKQLIESSVNSKAELHLLLGRDKIPMPLYTSEKVLPEANPNANSEQGLKWKVKCTVIFPKDQIIIREEGEAQNSKDAGNIAAYLVLQKVRELKRSRERSKRNVDRGDSEDL